MAVPFWVRAQGVMPAPRAEAARAPEVSVWSADLLSRERFQAFTPKHKVGGHVALGDLDGDGRAEIVIGAGSGASPEVQVFGGDGKRRAVFLAYNKDFKGGVRVAIGDLDGDGQAEIVTAPGPGMDPLIRRFKADGTFSQPNGFLAYTRSLRGGVNIAVGDLDGDGKAEIITAPGFTGGPHLRAWRGDFTPLGEGNFVFDQQLRDGLTVAYLRTSQGPRVAVSVEGWSEPSVRLYAWDASGFVFQNEFPVYTPGWKHGALLGAYDKDGDGFDDLVVTPNGGSRAELRVYARTGELLGTYLVMDEAYRGAVSAAGGDTNADGRQELVSLSLAPQILGPLDKDKVIHVNLSQQRIYAYEHGRIARTFLVSTGVAKYPTPNMETKVLSKVPVKRYRWIYGRNHPDNYDIPNVKWNLQVRGPYFIHGAYWHNDFGRRRSHGCINVHYSNAEWIYGWAEVGTPVSVFNKEPKLY